MRSTPQLALVAGSQHSGGQKGDKERASRQRVHMSGTKSGLLWFPITEGWAQCE